MRYDGHPRRIIIDDTPIPDSWQPDRRFEGMAVAIIGSGPSLATFDLDHVKGHRFIAVNSSGWRMAKIATANDILYFTDNSWAEKRQDLLDLWPGVVVSGNRNARIRIGDTVLWLSPRELVEKVWVFPDHACASSSHIAATLAAVMGASRIVLVAMECKEIDGRTHGHDEYRTQDLSVYRDRFLPGWNGLVKVWDKYGVDVVNATPDSAIECYRKLPLAYAFTG